MMDVMHAFQEERMSSRKAHLKYFFGVIPGDDDQYEPENGSYVVCYCGARLVPLSRDENDEIVSAAVWHNYVDSGRDADDY
jgi:hypothetical protein